MAAGTRTPLFSRRQIGGMMAIEDTSQTTGARWYVGSTVATASDAAGFGQNPDAPFATIDYAVGKCAASEGDVIYVMPGHVETVASAAALDLDVAGIKVVGLGWGALRPTISLTANLSTVECNAASMWIENIIFQGAFTNGVAIGVDVKTGCTGLTFKNCSWRSTSSTMELLKGVTIEATNDRISFIDCDWYEHGGDATQAVITEGAFSDLRFIRCTFRGTWATAVLDLDAAAVTDNALLVQDCVSMCGHATGGTFVTLDNTTEAFFVNVMTAGIQNNTLPIDAGDDGASCFVNCHGTDAVASSSLIWPATATAWS